MKRYLQKFIGDKRFYKTVFLLAVPMAMQQGITNFVNLLDNVMVGGLGTASISAVAIVNQLIFVFNLTIFGGLSGASIFGAQYAGLDDTDGLRHTFGFKLLLGTAVVAAFCAAYVFFGDRLIALYLTGSGGAAVAETMAEAARYLRIVLWGLFPYMVFQCLSTTLRETGETRPAMVASLSSLLINLVLNYGLIYGKFGLPRLGVSGAAIATVAARYVEMFYLLGRVLRKKDKHPFIMGGLRILRIPVELMKKIIRTGMPLLFNELLWAVSMAAINQCYSVRGLTTVAAVSINSTVWNLFSMFVSAMGASVSILVGQKLGAGDIDGAKDMDRKLITADVVMHIGIGAVIVALSGVVPLMYNTEQEVRVLASQLLVVSGMTLFISALLNAVYFTIRSGGRTLITFLFDSVFITAVLLPAMYVLCYHTALDVPTVYLLQQLITLLKMCVGFPILIKGTWARNVIPKAQDGPQTPSVA